MELAEILEDGKRCADLWLAVYERGLRDLEAAPTEGHRATIERQLANTRQFLIDHDVFRLL